jgi:hypothetical protein
MMCHISLPRLLESNLFLYEALDDSSVPADDVEEERRQVANVYVLRGGNSQVMSIPSLLTVTKDQADAPFCNMAML